MFKVLNQLRKLGAIEDGKRNIVLGAYDAPDFPGSVVMVNCQSALSMSNAANGTTAALPLKQGVVLNIGDAIISHEVSATQFARTFLRVLVTLAGRFARRGFLVGSHVFSAANAALFDGFRHPAFLTQAPYGVKLITP